MFTGQDLITWIEANGLKENPMVIIDGDIIALKEDYIFLAAESSFNKAYKYTMDTQSA